MTDAADALDAENGAKPTEDVVAGVIDDIDAAHDDYDRGYTDADATLAVVMSHVDRLREVRE